MLSAIVLAAGRASRFGACKQLALLDGRPLLGHVLDHLRAAAVEDVVVVLGAHAEEIRCAISFEGVRVVDNPAYAEGMSTSIQAGLRALPDGVAAAMIVLGDQPFVSPDTMRALRDESRRWPASIVVPLFRGRRGNPVVIPRAFFPELMSVRGDVGGRALLERHPHAVRTVEVDDRGILVDVDRAADLPPAAGPT